MGQMRSKRGWLFWIITILLFLFFLGGFDGNFIASAIATLITIGFMYLLFIFLAKFFG